MGYQLNDVASIGNKVGNAISNKPSVLYSFSDESDICDHSMDCDEHPSCIFTIDLK